jgi:hypothetical protein
VYAAEGIDICSLIDIAEVALDESNDNPVPVE